MGLFSKSDDVTRETKQRDKMVERGAKEAAKLGFDVTGSVVCAHVFQDGLASCVVGVWPDRVEVRSKGRAGSLLGKGAGTQSMPAGSIASVDTAGKGVMSLVRVHGSGNSLEFEAGQIDAEILRAAILEVAQAAKGGAPAPAAPPPPSVPAGWYPQGDVQRYWDGSAWTDHTAPLA